MTHACNVLEANLSVILIKPYNRLQEQSNSFEICDSYYGSNDDCIFGIV